MCDDEVADLYLLSTASMDQGAEESPLPAARCVVVGSTHIEEQLVSGGSRPEGSDGGLPPRCALAEALGFTLPPLVLAFFLSPCEPSVELHPEHIVRTVEMTIEAVAEWAALADEDALLLFRPHPRTDAALNASLEACCGGELPRLSVCYDTARRAANASVIHAANLTLSLGSAVATESICFGVPHVFVQFGWPASNAFLDANYAWLDVPRVSSVEGASGALAALTGVPGGTDSSSSPLVQMQGALRESAMGSLERAWGALNMLR